MADVIENEALYASTNSDSEAEATIVESETAEASALNISVRNGYSPFIGDNGYWYQWDSNIQAFVNTGVPANGSGEVQGMTNYNELKNLPTIGSETIKGDISSVIKQLIIDGQVDLSGYATLTYLNEQLKKINQINVPLWALSSTKPAYSISEIYDAAMVCSSGSYNDLINKPTAIKNPYILTIVGSSGLTEYDGSKAVTIDLNQAQIAVYDGLDSTDTSNALSANQGNVLKKSIDSLENEIDAIQVENNTTYSLTKNEGTYADTIYLIGSDGKADSVSLGLTSLVNRIQTLESDNAEGTDYNELNNLPTIGNETVKGDISTTIKQMISDGQVSVPSWALNPTKPTYSISEIVNATQVCSSGSYNDLIDKPTAIKNPYVLTVVGSSESTEYDGSKAVTIDLTKERTSVYDGLDSTNTSIAASANTVRVLAEEIRARTNTTYSLSKNEGTYADTIYLIGSDGKADSVSLGLTSLVNRIQTLESDNAEGTDYNDLINKPTAIKNPYILTVVGSSESTEYDGSKAVTIDLTKERTSVYDGLDSTNTTVAASANAVRVLAEEIRARTNTTYSLSKNEGTYVDTIYLTGSDGKADSISLGLTSLINRIQALESDNAELKKWKEQVMAGSQSVIIEE